MSFWFCGVVYFRGFEADWLIIVPVFLGRGRFGRMSLVSLSMLRFVIFEVEGCADGFLLKI